MDKFDEYKFFAQSTQYLSDRRHASTQIFLSINTAIFIIVTFRLRIPDLEKYAVVLTAFPIFFVGILVCFVWHQIIKRYKALIRWRFEQLMEMERRMPESYQMYLKEWEVFFQPRNKKETFGFSMLEVWLPYMFIALYVIAGAGLLIV